MRYLIILFALIGFSDSLCSQTLDTVWTKTYDFKQHPDDMYGMNAGVFASDSCFVLVSFANLWEPFDNGAIFLMKTDMEGDTLWTKYLGESLTNDVGTDIIETSDGNLMVLGLIQFEGNYGRIWLIKMTQDGDVIWDNVYLADTEYAWGHSITETSDGGFIVNGISESEILLLKVNHSGDSLWTEFFGGPSYDEGYGIAPTGDGGAVAAGLVSTVEVKWDSLLVIRVDSLGEEVWAETFPFAGGQNWSEMDIYKNSEDHFVLSVSGKPESGPIYYYKFDENGTVLSSSEICSGCPVTTLAICKGNDNATCITGAFGELDANTLVTKIDNDGDSLLFSELILSEYSIGNFIYQDDSGYIYIGGRFYESGTLYFTKLKESWPTGIAEENVALPLEYGLSQNYPNPFNLGTRIDYTLSRKGIVTIDIFNSLGRCVSTLVNDEKPAGNYYVTWDGTDFGGRRVASGIYYYQIHVDDYTESRKMMLLK